MSKNKSQKVLPPNPDRALEDLPHKEMIEALKEIGKETGRRAIAEAKAWGLPITYVEDGKIIKEHADGQKEILGEVPPTQKVKKGTVYEVKER